MNKREAPEWAQPGVEMVITMYGLGRRGVTYGRVLPIARRIGNGNIKLEGHDGQWRPSEDGTALLAGSDGYSRTSCTRVTDEIRQAIDLDRQCRAALSRISKEIERLRHIERNGTKEEIIAAAALIAEPSNA